VPRRPPLDFLAHQPIPHLRSYLKRSHSLRQLRVKMIAASRVDTIYRLGLVRTVAAGAWPLDGWGQRSHSAGLSRSRSSRGEGVAQGGRSARLVSKTPPELMGRNAVVRHSPCRFRMTDRRSGIAGSRSPRAVCAQRELVHPV
jgi:hypothetical protein